MPITKFDKHKSVPRFYLGVHQHARELYGICVGSSINDVPFTAEDPLGDCVAADANEVILKGSRHKTKGKASRYGPFM